MTKCIAYLHKYNIFHENINPSSFYLMSDFSIRLTGNQNVLSIFKDEQKEYMCNGMNMRREEVIKVKASEDVK